MCWGSVERPLGLVAAALGQIDRATAHFDAALAANRRLGAPLLVARTQRDAGVALDDRDRLAAALAAYDDERARTGTSPEPAAPPGAAGDEAVVVPLHRSGRPAHARRRRPPAWALGAAAALAAVLVAVPLLDRDRDDPGQSVASAPSDTADRSAATEAGPPGSAGVLDGGDLGDQSDPAVLGRVLAEAVSAEKAAALASPAAGASTAEAPAGSAVSPPLDARAPACLLYTSPSPRDGLLSRMPSSA